MVQNVNIGIIGAGAIGCLFGGYISQVESDKIKLNVHLYTREKCKKKISKEGLIIKKGETTRKFSKLTIFDEPALPKTKILDNNYAFTYLFLTTKAYDNASVILEYEDLIKKAKYFIILQNGIGNEDLIAEKFPNNKILRAITTNGALMEEDCSIIHTGQGLTKIGLISQKKGKSNQIQKEQEDKENLKSIKKILTLAGLETTIVEDIEKDCWEKAFINIGINAFGALTGLRNGELLQNSGLKNLMESAVIEAVNVAKAKGVKLEKKNYIDLMLNVARRTSNNKNSMLQDISKGKTKTEISFLNGKIVEYGKQLNIDVTINEILTNLIYGLEMSNRIKNT
jgi:2-dehydropantoate 2-reductase